MSPSSFPSIPTRTWSVRPRPFFPGTLASISSLHSDTRTSSSSSLAPGCSSPTREACRKRRRRWASRCSFSARTQSGQKRSRLAWRASSGASRCVWLSCSRRRTGTEAGFATSASARIRSARETVGSGSRRSSRASSTNRRSSRDCSRRFRAEREAVRPLRPLAIALLCWCFYHSGLTALIARWLPRRRPVILCAHRVVSEEDPFFPGIRYERFAAEIAYLARHHLVLPLDEMIEATLNGRPLPRGAVAITLDDGFADNFHLAYPILRRYRVPATIFLVAESVERGRLPWPERVAYLLQHTERTRLEISLPEPKTFSVHSQADKLEALASLLTLLKTCEDEARRRAVEELEAGLLVGPDHGMMLTWEQCRRMAQSGISFGAHTLTHPILPQTEAVEMKHEIADSKASIEAQVGCGVRYFAYPNDDFCRATVEAVEAAGFEAAFAGARHVRQTPEDRFTIGRRPWVLGPVSVFAAEVSGLLDELSEFLFFLC